MRSPNPRPRHARFCGNHQDAKKAKRVPRTHASRPPPSPPSRASLPPSQAGLPHNEVQGFTHEQLLKHAQCTRASHMA